MHEIVWRCHVVVYIVMGVIVVASENSPSAYIRGLILRIDQMVNYSSNVDHVTESSSNGDLLIQTKFDVGTESTEF